MVKVSAGTQFTEVKQCWDQSQDSLLHTASAKYSKGPQPPQCKVEKVGDHNFTFLLIIVTLVLVIIKIMLSSLLYTTSTSHLYTLLPSVWACKTTPWSHTAHYPELTIRWSNTPWVMDFLDSEFWVYRALLTTWICACCLICSAESKPNFRWPLDSQEDLQAKC